jgi:hypothetical protein
VYPNSADYSIVSKTREFIPIKSSAVILEVRREFRIRESNATVKGAYWLSRETVFALVGTYQSLISEDELDGYVRDIGVEEAGQLVTT